MTRPTGGPRAASTTTAAPRLLYLDNLRILLTVLVVVHHAALTYGNLPLWYYHEPAQDPSGIVLDVLVAINQTFFMGFFFLISGFFTPGSYDRRGGRGFVRGRLVRLGIPLLAFMLVLRPLLNFGGLAPLREAFAQDGAALPYWRYYLLSWDPGPMWFVEVLLVFTLVYALLRTIRGQAAPVAQPARAPAPLAIAGFVAVLGLVTFAWRFAVPVGTYWAVVGLPSPSHLPQYVLLFVIGALAYRRGWLTALPARYGRVGFIAAGASLVAFAVASVALRQAGGAAQLLLAAVCEAAFATSLIIGLLVVYRERWNRQRAFGRCLSADAYAVYVVHPLVLVALGYALSWLHASAVVKFLVLAVLAVPQCWMLAHAVRSLPHVKRVL